MRSVPILLAVSLGALTCAIFVGAQQGPKSDSSNTVSRPKRGAPKTDSAPAAEPDQPKIPSRFGKGKENAESGGVATFSTDAITVTVDTAVLDNKGHFIPNIPKNS